MAIHVVSRAEILPGTETILDGPAPDGKLAAFFEDDGESGYFYALDPRQAEDPIQDAVLIYVVENVTDRHLSSTAQIAWSADNRKAVLLINGVIHAAFDFVAKRGYCRTGFPQPSPSSDWLRLEWAQADESLLA